MLLQGRELNEEFGKEREVKDVRPAIWLLHLFVYVSYSLPFSLGLRADYTECVNTVNKIGLSINNAIEIRLPNNQKF